MPEFWCCTFHCIKSHRVAEHEDIIFAISPIPLIKSAFHSVSAVLCTVMHGLNIVDINDHDYTNKYTLYKQVT